jgi:hypothetical protein
MHLKVNKNAAFHSFGNIRSSATHQISGTKAGN